MTVSTDWVNCDFKYNREGLKILVISVVQLCKVQTIEEWYCKGYFAIQRKFREKCNELLNNIIINFFALNIVKRRLLWFLWIIYFYFIQLGSSWILLQFSNWKYFWRELRTKSGSENNSNLTVCHDHLAIQPATVVDSCVAAVVNGRHMYQWIGQNPISCWLLLLCWITRLEYPLP